MFHRESNNSISYRFLTKQCGNFDRILFVVYIINMKIKIVNFLIIFEILLFCSMVISQNLSPTQVLEKFRKAIINKDFNTFFSLFSKEIQLELINEYGGDFAKLKKDFSQIIEGKKGIPVSQWGPFVTYFYQPIINIMKSTKFKILGVNIYGKIAVVSCLVIGNGMECKTSATLVKEPDGWKIWIGESPISPDCISAIDYNEMGLNASDPATAIKYYKKAIELDPKWDVPYCNIGITYGNIKKYEYAVNWVKKAIELNPYEAKYRKILGELYEELGKYAEAIVQYEKGASYAISEKREFCLKIADLYYNLGKYDYVIAWLERANKLEEDWETNYKLAGLYYRKNKQEIAFKKLHKARKLAIDEKDINGIEFVLAGKFFGGSNDDEAYSIQQTSDGGYIVAGYTNSFGAGYSDFYIIKLDASGNKVWKKTYGGSSDDWARSIQQTSDGGYIVAGETSSFGAGYSDFYIIKLDANGNKVWQKTYGGSSYDVAYSIQQTSDGGYIVAGETYSFGVGGSDFYIIKLDAYGNKIWEKTYGGSSDDYAYSIQQTSDGGYIVAGDTSSFGAGYYDFYIIKLDAYGNKIWEKTYGGSSDDWASSIQQTRDGGYIVAGGTSSFGAGYYDFYIIKLDASGNKVWEKTYGGSSEDYARSIQQTSDGGYIVAGDTESFGAGYYDFYIIKLDAYGNKIWEKTYGGSDRDYAYSIQQTSDGGYIVAGGTYSFGAGKYDFYIIKLDANGNTGPYPY
jgi:uncharacterized delta-60 repeat protein